MPSGWVCGVGREKCAAGARPPLSMVRTWTWRVKPPCRLGVKPAPGAAWVDLLSYRSKHTRYHALVCYAIHTGRPHRG